MIKSVLLTITNSRKAGGLYNSVRNLAKSIIALKACDMCILSHNDEYSKDDIYAYEGIPMKFYKIYGPSNFSFTFNLYSQLKSISPLIIHQQGIWTFASFVNLLYRIKRPVKCIISPRGMLDPWAVKNSSWKKNIIGKLFEYKNLRNADCIHALCFSEYESIRKFGLTNPVAVIPNGINLPKDPQYNRNHERKVLLYIGRIHPKKGLKELILGLAKIKEYSPDLFASWEVHIAGWDQNGHLNELKKLVRIHNLNNDVVFLGSLYGEVKEKELCYANAFILPSFSEGLPMSVLEAWAFELPVIMTKYCNIPEGFNNKCAIQIEPSQESIYKELISFFQMSDYELANMGKNGKMLVKESFTWDVIAKQTVELYNYLLKKGNKPSFVYED